MFSGNGLLSSTFDQIWDRFKTQSEAYKWKTDRGLEIVKVAIQAIVGAKDGQNKCPKCGATDISLNAKKGVLRCNFRGEVEKTNKHIMMLVYSV